MPLRDDVLYSKFLIFIKDRYHVHQGRDARLLTVKQYSNNLVVIKGISL